MSFERVSAVNEIRRFISEYPEYSLGEILYSFCRIANKGSNKISDLLDIKDEEIVSSIEKAIEYERE